MAVAKITNPRDADRPDDPAWHEAMWIVGASLNDRTRADANAQARLEELARRNPDLPNLLRQNRGNSPVSRVAMYYAFLIEPSLDAAEAPLNAVDPASEECRFGRALLPWLRCVSWIAARMSRVELIQLVQQKVDAVSVPSGELADACRNEIDQRIRPWIALASLANDYVATRSRMKSGNDRTAAMTNIAQDMAGLAGALDRGDLERLLADQHPGRRLVAYAVLTAIPVSGLRAQTISALLAETQPFLQYWGLQAIRALVSQRPAITAAERSALDPLRSRLGPATDRAAVLRQILATPQPLSGKRILWVDDHRKNIDTLAREFRNDGAFVQTVATTDAVFSELSKAPFDLVISDLNREGNSEAGFDMIRRLRQSGSRVSVAIHSPFLNEQRLLRAAELGVPCFGDSAALRAAVTEWNWPAPVMTPTAWMLVAGTGRASGLAETARNGAALAAAVAADRRAGLITGGWPGVDYIAAREFAAAVEARGAAVDSFLLHILEGSAGADFKQGRVERVAPGESVAESVRRADTVVLVGGEGGTWNIFRAALAAGKPVIPLAGSGGDAECAWKLMRLCHGASHLQSPLSPLTYTAVRDALPALGADLEHPPDLSIGTGPLVVDLVTAILPLAADYMRPVPMDEFERTAGQIRKQLQSWSEFIEDAIPVLLADPNPEWRVTGYFAFQTHPQPGQIPALLDCLPVELREVEAGRETRPLFQWINSVYTCVTNPTLRAALPPGLAQQLRSALTLLEHRNDVDPGGECKSFLRSVLTQLG